jgi:hypothetical protein
MASFVALMLAGSGVAVAETGASERFMDEVKRADLALLNRADWLDVGFLMEVEGFYGKSGSVSDSDLVLATVELTLGGQVMTNLGFHVGLLWEEDDTQEDNLDEGYIILGGSEEMPFYVEAGRKYLPFGHFESCFISDPFTLELAETRKSTVQAGYGSDLFRVSAAVFKGDSAGKRGISDGVVALDVTPDERLSVGVYWISDIMETDGQVEVLSALDRVGGAGAYLHAVLGPVAFHAEFVSALETVAEINAKPMAYHAELSFDCFERWTTGLRFEGSDEFDGVADRRLGCLVSCAVHDHLSIGCEYMHGMEDGGSDSDQVTVQLAMAF